MKIPSEYIWKRYHNQITFMNLRVGRSNEIGFQDKYTAPSLQKLIAAGTPSFQCPRFMIHINNRGWVSMSNPNPFPFHSCTISCHFFAMYHMFYKYVSTTILPFCVCYNKVDLICTFTASLWFFLDLRCANLKKIQ